MRVVRIMSEVETCAVNDMYRLVKEYRRLERRIKEGKAQFDAMVESLCRKYKTERLQFEEIDPSGKFVAKDTSIGVTMVERTTVVWDAQKLERRLPKRLAHSVIEKSYTISDMKGLSQYLKSCGVDPEVFKRYITVNRNVNEKALEDLSNRGEVPDSVANGCYEVRRGKPYFVLKGVKNGGDGEPME